MLIVMSMGVTGITFLDLVLSPFLPQAHGRLSLYDHNDSYVNLFLIADTTTIVSSHHHSPLLLFSSLLCTPLDLSLVSGGSTRGVVPGGYSDFKIIPP